MAHKYKPRPLFTHTCPICGSAFEASGKATYCGTTCNHRGQYEKHMLDPFWRLSKLVSMAKNRATCKSLKFNLDADYMLQLWKDNDGQCAISGITLDLTRSNKGKVNPYAPSIDRIIPSKGYTKGNVRIICYQANVALSEFGLDQLEEFMELYRQNKMGVS